MQSHLSLLDPRKPGKPSARTKTLGVRISESDYAALEQRAWQSGKSLADWAREILLEGINGEDTRSLLNHIFTEQIGTQLILMNGLAPLLSGETLTKERAAQIFKEVQATKATCAKDLLARRRAQAREQASSNAG